MIPFRRSSPVAVGLILAVSGPAPGAPASPAERVAPDLFSGGVSPCAMRPADPERGPGPRATPAPPVEILPDAERDVRVVRWLGVEARLLSEEIPFEVREGTVGLTLRAEALTDDWRISVELLSETGELIACNGCPDAPAVGEVRAGRGTTQMPSTDRPGGELLPGRYAFRVRSTPAEGGDWTSGGATVNVTAAFRTEAAVTVERRLDLNFVYLPNSTLSAAIASTSPRFAEMLQLVDEWLEPTGIRIGRVTHVDLDRPAFDVIATWEEAGRMFRTSAFVGRPRALNVYCVRTFEPPLNPVVGLSGGIPGPLANGTRDSGIAIKMEPFFSAPNLGAYASLFAHEIGHYLGFYHTTEADLQHWDPLLDTPECTGGLDDTCPDYAYVMFPLIHYANHVWSPSQVGISRTHPIVRTVPVVRRAEPSEAPEDPRIAVGPNPFDGSVRLALPEGSAAEVTLHDVAGRLVRRLPAGGGVAQWDGRAADGRVAPAGIYFARVAGPDGRIVTTRLVKSR